MMIEQRKSISIFSGAGFSPVVLSRIEINRWVLLSSKVQRSTIDNVWRHDIFLYYETYNDLAH
jgi:hypothetical protein